MRPVQIDLEDDLARKLEVLTDEEKKEFSKLITIWLARKRNRPVTTVIDEVSAYAKEQGITQKILDELLRNNN